MNFKEILRKIVDRLVCLLLPLVLSIGCFFITGCPEAQQVMKPVVETPAEEPAEMPTTTVSEVKQEMPEKTKPEPTSPTPVEPVEPTPPVDTTPPTVVEPTAPEEPIETDMEEPISTVTLPPGYELPPELIPTTPPTLSADEAALMEADKWVQQNHPDFDVTAPKLRTQVGHTADLISLLPYKEREEVYELFVASINLPSFTEAAQKMWDINMQLGLLNGEGERTGDWDPYWSYLLEASQERGFFGQTDLNTLSSIYFEERPEDKQYSQEGISFYWIILEYYRLQLENPSLPNFLQKNNPTGLLNLFRQSCRKGYVLGLDNPLE